MSWHFYIQNCQILFILLDSWNFKVHLYFCYVFKSWQYTELYHYFIFIQRPKGRENNFIGVNHVQWEVWSAKGKQAKFLMSVYDSIGPQSICAYDSIGSHSICWITQCQIGLNIIVGSLEYARQKTKWPNMIKIINFKCFIFWTEF